MSFSAWPTIPALCALLLVAADYSGRLSTRTPRTPKWPVSFWIAALIGTYGVQLGIINYGARHESNMDASELAMMPIPAFQMLPVNEVPHPNLVCAAMLVLAGLQAYALLALYRSEPSRAAVRIGFGAMLLMSVSSPALVSADLYGYVHDGVLGLGTYTPSKLPFQGEYHIFDLLYGVGHTPPYGPLWFVIAQIVTAAAPTLLGKILALRCFSLLLFLCFIAGLQALRLPPRIRNVAALNPGLMLEFVCDGHNDLLPIALLVWAALWVRARPAFAFGMIAAAGLLKLSFVFAGLPIAAAIRPIRTRSLGSIATIILVIALSWGFGKLGYADSLIAHVNQYHPNVVQQVAGVVALLLMLIAAGTGRRLIAGAWIAPAFSAAVYSWYFIWGLPYALARHRILGSLLVGFPFITMLIGSAFQRLWELNLVLPAIMMILLLAPNRRTRQASTIGEGVPAFPLATRQ